MQYALSYHEPTLLILLITSSFILLLSLLPSLLAYVDLSLISLLIQLFIGTVFGPPLGDILPESTCKAVVDLGYIGLVLLVYEGGLSTSVPALLSELLLSLAVAATGILLPIALSFSLKTSALGGGDGATWLQAFTCGAALSATSLGTTFTLLSGAGMADTRMGVVLTSAAMIDDVIGLVMINVVSSLADSGGEEGGGHGKKIGIAEALARPIGASIGLLVVVFVACWLLGKCRGRIERSLLSKRLKTAQKKTKRDIVFVIHTSVLTGVIAGAYYAGTSVLFAAFLVGAAISWWDETATTEMSDSQSSAESEALDIDAEHEFSTKGMQIYEHLYAPVVERVLKPFFFASIGFAIPLRKMFDGPTVWRGIVYSVLMTIAKAATGVWLMPRPSILAPKRVKTSPASASMGEKAHSHKKMYAPTILGMAMVARGEIAFLIASVADSSGIFKGSEQLFLIVIWASVVCTCIGPLVVGLLVRKVKREGVDIVLGQWGKV